MLLPLVAFIVNGLLIRPFVNRKSKIYGYITILAIGGLGGVIRLGAVLRDEPGEPGNSHR